MSSADPALTFRFENNRDAVAEAMLLAGQELKPRGASLGVSILMSVLYYVLMTAGGAALALVITIFATRAAPESLWPYALGGAFGGWFAFVWYGRMIDAMAGEVLAKPFNQGWQEMQFDRQGVRLRNDAGDWFTDWSGVHAVALGKDTLAVCISGIALYVPIADIDQPQAVLDQLLDWKREATG